MIAIIPDLSQPRQRGAGVADVARRLATLDRGQDRLQHRAGIAVRPGVAPQLREVGSRAQFEQTRFLAASDLNGFFETGFRARPRIPWSSRPLSDLSKDCPRPSMGRISAISSPR